MVRVAAERISELFTLAGKEATAGRLDLADRYVLLARRIGMRYNVRLPREYAELHCRGCSRYWVEGRTVRTRLRSGHQVRTCLYCGRDRRVVIPRAGRTGEGPDPRAGVTSHPSSGVPRDADEGWGDGAENPSDVDSR